MASKNSIKIYAEDSFYHIYNRGVEKRTIFYDQQDYSVFLSYLQTYLSPKDELQLSAIISSEKSSRSEKDKALKQLHLKNYFLDLELICYALLPNHFHLLIRQKSNVMARFMNSIGTRYGMYFNRKYKRTGILFQDIYKAVLVESDEQLLHLSRYINLNPSRFLKLPVKKWSESTSPCSLPEYLSQKKTSWVKPKYILDYFSKTTPNSSYENFLGMQIDSIEIAKIAIDLEED